MLGCVRVLAIDTSTPSLVVGVVNDGERVAATVIPDCRDQNQLLTPTTLDVLTTAGVGFGDLDAVVVGCGPGPFTGLRVGIATAQAFADAVSIPVYGVCSLDAIARASAAEKVLVCTDARRKEVYWAEYEARVRVAGPDVVRPEELDVATPEAVNVPGHLAERLPDALRTVPRYDTAPLPEHLVAACDFSSAPVPLYLRRPDAKEPAARPKSAAIPDVEL